MSDGAPALATIQETLDAITSRLDAAAQTPEIQEISARVFAVRREVEGWAKAGAGDAVCVALMQKLVAVEMALMAAGVRPAADSSPALSDRA